MFSGSLLRRSPHGVEHSISDYENEGERSGELSTGASCLQILTPVRILFGGRLLSAQITLFTLHIRPVLRIFRASVARPDILNKKPDTSIRIDFLDDVSNIRGTDRWQRRPKQTKFALINIEVPTQSE